MWADTREKGRGAITSSSISLVLLGSGHTGNSSRGGRYCTVECKGEGVHTHTPSASWAENTFKTECTQERGHHQSTVLSILWLTHTRGSDLTQYLASVPEDWPLLSCTLRISLCLPELKPVDLLPEWRDVYLVQNVLLAGSPQYLGNHEENYHSETDRKLSRAVFRFRIRIHRIHMFLGLPDPDPLVRGMDPSMIYQQAKILIPTVLWFLFDY